MYQTVKGFDGQKVDTVRLMPLFEINIKTTFNSCGNGKKKEN